MLWYVKIVNHYFKLSLSWLKTTSEFSSDWNIFISLIWSDKVDANVNRDTVKTKHRLMSQEFKYTYNYCERMHSSVSSLICTELQSQSKCELRTFKSDIAWRGFFHPLFNLHFSHQQTLITTKHQWIKYLSCI